MSGQGLSPTGRDIPAMRRVVLNDVSQLPADYSTTPGGTHYSTTPGGYKSAMGSFPKMNIGVQFTPGWGEEKWCKVSFPRIQHGTRIIYDRSRLMQLRNSPLAKSPPANMAKIPGITDFDATAETAKDKENGRKEETREESKTTAHDDHPQFEMDI